jgi:hypothetical protein
VVGLTVLVPEPLAAIAIEALVRKIVSRESVKKILRKFFSM